MSRAAAAVHKNGSHKSEESGEATEGGHEGANGANGSHGSNGSVGAKGSEGLVGVTGQKLSDLVPIEGAAPVSSSGFTAPQIVLAALALSQTLVTASTTTIEQLCYALVHAIQSMLALDPKIEMTGREVQTSSGKLSAKGVTAMRAVTTIAASRPAAFAVQNEDGTTTQFDVAKTSANLDRWSLMQTAKVAMTQLLEVIKVSQLEIGTETRADVRGAYEVAVAIAKKDNVMKKLLATPRAVFGQGAATRKANAQPAETQAIRVEKADRSLALANTRQANATAADAKVKAKVVKTKKG